MFPTFFALKKNIISLLQIFWQGQDHLSRFPGGSLGGGKMRAGQNSHSGQEWHRKHELISFWIFFQLFPPNCHCCCLTIKNASWISKADALSMGMLWWVGMNEVGVIFCDMWYLWLSTLKLNPVSPSTNLAEHRPDSSFWLP